MLGAALALFGLTLNLIFKLGFLSLVPAALLTTAALALALLSDQAFPLLRTLLELVLAAVLPGSGVRPPGSGMRSLTPLFDGMELPSPGVLLRDG